MLQESETVELKAIIVDDVKKEIVALANSAGGTLYIGVADDGGIAGVDLVWEASSHSGQFLPIEPDLFCLWRSMVGDKGSVRPRVSLSGMQRNP